MSIHLSIDACWYLDKFIWITVSSSAAWDNEMLWQRNIQEVILYFVQKDKLVLYMEVLSSVLGGGVT